MMNLSSLSKAQYANIASLGIFIITFILEVIFYGFHLLQIFGILNFALVNPSNIIYHQPSKEQTYIQHSSATHAH